MDEFSRAYRLPNGERIKTGALWVIAEKWEHDANAGKVDEAIAAIKQLFGVAQ